MHIALYSPVKHWSTSEASWSLLAILSVFLCFFTHVFLLICQVAIYVSEAVMNIISTTDRVPSSG